MNNLTSRLSAFITHRNISISEFEKSISASNGSIRKAIKGNNSLVSDKLEKIFSLYPELNPTWLLTGQGQMLKTPDNVDTVIHGGGNLISDNIHAKKVEQNIGSDQESQKKIELLQSEIDNLKNKLDLSKQEVTMWKDNYQTLKELFDQFKQMKG